MKTTQKIYRWVRLGGVGLALAGMALSIDQAALAQERKIIGILPVKSMVESIPADAAQEMLINTIANTNQFAIRPPDAKGSFAGVDYVFEPTIKEGKGKNNALGFLKETVLADAPLVLDIRVFEARSNALISVVTAKSADAKASKPSTMDLQMLMGTVKADAPQPSDAAKLEERLGGLMLQAANSLAAQLGGGASGGQVGGGGFKSPFSR